MVVGVIGWIVLGFFAGYVASTPVNSHGEGLPINTGLGVGGAVIGGWLFNAFGAADVTGFNTWSLIAAVIGAVVFLVAWHAIVRSARHA
jgi:uncharacterized membrane protein YeaQ/YmgE (transglycosylase-associated protein family)